MLLIGAMLMLLPAGRFLECQVLSCYEPTPIETLARLDGWYVLKSGLAIALAGAAIFSIGAVQRHRKRPLDIPGNNVAQD